MAQAACGDTSFVDSMRDVVRLEPEGRARPPGPAIEQPTGSGKSSLVSLRLDIATYFRRPGTPDDSTP